MFVTLLASDREIPSGHVWGTGGWEQPQEREALDWLTLVRILGWDLHVASLLDEPGEWLRRSPRVIIMACDPDSLGEATVDAVAYRLNDDPLLVVCRAGRSGTPLARLAGTSLDGEATSGRLIEWHGPGPHRAWRSAKVFEGQRLLLEPEARSWAELEGFPVVSARRYGHGTVVTLGVHPSEVRDIDPAGTALLKAVLTWGLPPPVAWLDFDHTLVLRMDDPGGAQNIYGYRGAIRSSPLTHGTPSVATSRRVRGESLWPTSLAGLTMETRAADA